MSGGGGQCPLQCGISIAPGSSVQEHQRVCPMLVVPCPYAPMGCDYTCPRKLLYEHEQELVTSHMSLLCATVEERDIAVADALEEKDRVIQQLSSKVDKLAETVEILARVIQDRNTTIAGMKLRMDSLQETLDALPKSRSTSIPSSNVGAPAKKSPRVAEQRNVQGGRLAVGPTSRENSSSPTSPRVPTSTTASSRVPVLAHSRHSRVSRSEIPQLQVEDVSDISGPSEDSSSTSSTNSVAPSVTPASKQHSDTTLRRSTSSGSAVGMATKLERLFVRRSNPTMSERTPPSSPVDGATPPDTLSQLRKTRRSSGESDGDNEEQDQDTGTPSKSECSSPFSYGRQSTSSVTTLIMGFDQEELNTVSPSQGSRGRRCSEDVPAAIRTQVEYPKEIPAPPPVPKTSPDLPLDDKTTDVVEVEPVKRKTPEPTSPRDTRVECVTCGRKFAPHRIEKHSAVCIMRKEEVTRRPVYNSAKARITGTVVEKFFNDQGQHLSSSPPDRVSPVSSPNRPRRGSFNQGRRPSSVGGGGVAPVSSASRRGSTATGPSSRASTALGGSGDSERLQQILTSAREIREDTL